jgi:hypothetical protein
MNFSATAKWICLALLGLAIAAAVAVAASNLVSRQIGIASESVSAGDALAPAVESVGRQGNEDGGSRKATAATDDDDNGGGSEGGDGDGGEVSPDELEDRIDEEEDARDEAEDAAEDRAKELEDLEDDNSGKGSDD